MRTTIAFLFVFAFTISTIAQESSENDPNQFRTKKNEIGIGMFNAFALSSSPSPNILYKRFTNNGAFRIGVGGSSSSNDRSRTYLNLNQDQNVLKDVFNSSTANFGLGYEYHIPMNRWMLFVGADAIASYSLLKDEYKVEFTNNYYNEFGEPVEYKRTNEDKRTTETFGVGAKTFIGMKFWINDRISINTQFEARFIHNFSTYEYVNSSEYSIPIFENTSDSQNSRSTSLVTSLSPLGLLSFNFHF